MRTLFSAFLFSLFFCPVLFCQSDIALNKKDTLSVIKPSSIPQNYVTLELFGTGGIGSVNYERIVYKELGVRIGTIGLSSIAMLTYHPEKAIVDLSAGVRYMDELNFISLGGSVNPTSNVHPVAAMGIFLNKSAGWSTKFSIVASYTDKRVVPFFGLSGGYAF